MQELYSLKIKNLYRAFISEGIAFWCACLYLFFEYVRPQSAYPAIDIIPWGKTTILLTAITWLIADKKNKIPTYTTFHSLFLIFFTLIIASSIFAYRPEISFSKLSDFYFWLIIFIILTGVIRTEQRFFIFLLLFLAANFKMSLHGFTSWASIGFQFRDWGVTGAPGWFHNSGEFGVELCLVFPIVAFFTMAIKKHLSLSYKLFFYFFILTVVGSAIATSSRGAMLGVAATILYMILISKYKFKILFYVAIIGAIALSYVPDETKLRFEYAGEDTTSTLRLERWEAGIKMMNEHPLLGVGFRNWSWYYLDRYPENVQGISHNIFIEVGSELGYTGLVLCIIMFAYSFIYNHRTRRIAKNNNDNYYLWMAHGFDAALIGFITSGFFVTVYYYPYFWINAVFVAALHNIVKAKYAKKIDRPSFVR